MNQKRFTHHEVVQMTLEQYRAVEMCLSFRYWHLLGIPWTKHMEIFKEPETGDIVVNYE